MSLPSPSFSKASLPSSQFLFEGRRSISGKKWVYQEPDVRETLAIAQTHRVTEFVASILLKRGVGLSQVPQFLTPTLKEMMPDPSHLKDMDKGVERIVQALNQGEKIAIFGDYDVDGATSSALLKRYFRDIGAAARIYIPQRIEEGYGPNTLALRQLKQEGYSVIIMVDCGTTAFEPLTAAAEMGQDIIVLDHHMSQPSLPPACAIINPNRLDEDSPLKNVCAAGMAFLFMVALHRRLRAAGYFTGRTEPDTRQYLDLVALGTVCDVMPLTGLNRAFVSQGLKVMAMRSNLGLTALSDISGMDDYPTAYHLGFLIGPRINAGGRVGRADHGARLLSTLDPIEARTLAEELNQLNAERKEVEQFVLEQALQKVERDKLDSHPIILVGEEGWHPGVIGIVAGRLKERYNRPVCVVGFDQGIGKGSGRSIQGVNLGNAMHTATHKGLLVYGGGHAMAAGFTVEQDKFQAFYDHLIEQLQEQVALTEPSIEVDAVLTPSGATEALVDELKGLEPYGSGNHSPKFCLHRARVNYAERIGINHIRCQLVGADGSKVKAMAFRAAETPMGDLILSRNNQYIEVVGSLKVDTWNGRRTVTCFIDDVME